MVIATNFKKNSCKCLVLIKKSDMIAWNKSNRRKNIQIQHHQIPEKYFKNFKLKTFFESCLCQYGIMFCVPVCTYYKLQREQEARIYSRVCLKLEIISYPWLLRRYLNSLDQGNSGFDWKRWLHKGKLLYIYFWFDYENTSDWRSHLSRLISNFKIQTST